MWLLGTAIMFAIPILLGCALLYLARWSRKKSEQMMEGGPHVPFIKKHIAWHEGNRPEFVRVLLFSNVSRNADRAGRALAVITMLGVAAVLVFIAYKIMIKIA